MTHIFSLPPAFHMCIYKRSSMAYHQVTSLEFNLSTHWCRATPFCRHNLGMGLKFPESLASLMSLLTTILQCEHFHRSQFWRRQWLWHTLLDGCKGLQLLDNCHDLERFCYNFCIGWLCTNMPATIGAAKMSRFTCSFAIWTRSTFLHANSHGSFLYCRASRFWNCPCKYCPREQ